MQQVATAPLSSFALALVSLASLLSGCAGEGPPDDGPVRVVFVADTHIIGPQYTEPRENSPADNESIFRTVERALAIRETVHAIRPRPSAVFVLGDVVHDAHHSPDFDWYLENESAFSVAAEIFAGFEMPVHFVFGNHDYAVRCGSGTTYEAALSERLFSHFFGADPYSAVDLGGFRLLLTNPQKGPTWDRADSRCNTSRGSFGEAQLEWLEEQLGEGKPTLVLTHHMSVLHLRNEAPGRKHPDLISLLNAHDNVRGIFGGHTHRWLDMSFLHGERFEEHVLGAARYDADNFWVLELDGAAGTYEILDREKRIEANSCGRTFDYSREPYAVIENAAETGTCVQGTEG